MTANLRQPTPDQVLSQYFALHQRVASCGAVSIDGMPRGGRDPDSAERLRVELAELHWYCQDLTPGERQVAAARVLGAGARVTHFRYLVSLAEVQPDEEPTGGRHPADPSLVEVRSGKTRWPTYQEIATHLRVPVREVFELYNSARRKVGLRLYWRRR